MTNISICLLILSIPTVLGAEEITSGVDVARARIGNIAINSSPRQLFSEMKAAIRDKGYHINFFEGRDFDLLEGRQFIYSVDIKDASIKDLLDAVCKAGNWQYSIQKHAVIVDRNSFPEDKEKKKLLHEQFGHIIIPSMQLPYWETRRDSEFTRFKNYCERIEYLAKENDPAQIGVNFQLKYKKGDFFDNDWLINLYYNLPDFKANNIPLDEMLYYIGQSSGLKYEIADNKTITFHSKPSDIRTMPDEFSTCRSIFSLDGKYVINSLGLSNLYVETYLAQGKTKTKSPIDKTHLWSGVTLPLLT